ncbi:hypothetical protein CPB97_002026 [Podila verticillata]|nr:hypothetical protein CPB97_002026 [Podila verticillata]
MLTETGNKKLMRTAKRIDHYLSTTLISEDIYVIIEKIDPSAVSKDKATPEYDLRSQHKNGSVDYSILSTTDDKLVLGVIEVKYRDVQSGITQNAFQLHAALMNRNRKFDGAHK